MLKKERKISSAFIDLWKSRDLVQLRDLQDEEPWRVVDGRLFNSLVWGELLQSGTSHG